MGGLEPIEFGLDVQFFVIHGFFVQDPGPGEVKILEATTNEPDAIFNSRIYLIQGLLQGIHISENPMVLEVDL
jgi:hypothetical protein